MTLSGYAAMPNIRGVFYTKNVLLGATFIWDKTLKITQRTYYERR